jgi:sigma-B regulation protein RsbU (phosphoserine phosphatase)
VLELKRTGIALGVEEGIPYNASEEISLESGDLLALFTDGILETRRDQEMFGGDRLVSLLTRHRDRPAAEIVRLVLDEVSRFGENRVDDDLTLVVVRVLEE